ncbi:hypothetical protein [Mesorhizobium metallidurans]|nr:hypothetical protein [Mesorhizobium metallidurans]
MAKVKNLNKEIVNEPEVAGARIERKNSSFIQVGQVSVAAKTVGSPFKDTRSIGDLFPARQSAARPLAGKTPRPTAKPGE